MRQSMKLIFALIIAPLFLSACEEEEQAAPAGPEIKVSTPYVKTITEWDEYTGRFRAVEEVEVRARVSGYLKEVTFEDGQIVSEGDVLFVIDQRPFAIALKEAEAQHTLAKKEFDRAVTLRKRGAASQELLDSRTQALAMAEAALDRARLNMEFTQVKAPISGRISRDLVTKGNLINGSDLNATTLTSIVSLDPIHFYFEASERELLKYIRLDQAGKREASRTKANPVEVQLQDETGYPHKGHMDFVDNRIDISTGTIQGRAVIPNPDGIIQPGIFGRARLLASEEYEAILVPDALIGTDQSRKFVYVVNDENTVQMRPVTLGPVYDTTWRIIRNGLNAEDRIVARSIQRVRPGMVITPAEVSLTDEYQ